VKRQGSVKLLGVVVIWMIILGAIVVIYKIPGALDWLKDLVGGTEVTSLDTLEVPFILWGGDVATFHANGGLETKEDTIFQRLGLKAKLVRCDDFNEQVKNYLARKSHFLRGTFSMLGQASEKVSADPGARPVVFLQLTWSAGDYMVARSNCKTLADLKGKRIALQKYGPHVGMLDDILRTARIGWKEIDVVWTPDVSGPKGPAAELRNQPSVDACFAITPEMEELTGGKALTGTGAGKSVKDAHVLVSTVDMKRSIADVYACRKDFFDAHREWVEKFAAGYLKACEELMEMKKDYSPKNKEATPKYNAILALTQEIYGKEDIASVDVTDGLISDAVFVRLPGNRSFFTESSPDNFEGKQKAALDLAIALGDAKERHEFLKPAFDYEQLAKLGGLTTDLRAGPGRLDPGLVLPAGKDLESNTLFAFEIRFPNGITEFDVGRYGLDFQRAVEQASLFGRAIIAVRGHADLSGVLGTFVRAGQEKGLLKRTATQGKYLLQQADTVLDLGDTAKIERLVDSGEFESDQNRPRELLVSVRKLSQQRAEMARRALLEYARSKNYSLDENQIRAVGVGISDPVVPVPRSDEEYARNRRVEFRLLKTNESPLPGDKPDY